MMKDGFRGSHPSVARVPTRCRACKEVGVTAESSLDVGAHSNFLQIPCRTAQCVDDLLQRRSRTRLCIREGIAEEDQKR